MLQTAQWRRLAIYFLSKYQTTELYETLETTAKESNSALLMLKHKGIFQINLSYFYNGQVIILLQHVSVVPKGSLLRLVKLHRFPLSVSRNNFIFPDVESKILLLSVSEARMSAQSPATKVMGCNQINQTDRSLSQEQGVLNKDLAQSCLVALYQWFPTFLESRNHDVFCDLQNILWNTKTIKKIKFGI